MTIAATTVATLASRVVDYKVLVDELLTATGVSLRQNYLYGKELILHAVQLPFVECVIEHV